MKLFKILLLIGLMVTVVGLGFSQMTTQDEKELKYQNLWLTESNSSWVIDLGNLESGTKVILTFTTPEEDIAVVLIRTSTKEFVPWRGATAHKGAGEQTLLVDNGYKWIKNGPARYDLSETDHYEMTVSIPTDISLLVGHGYEEPLIKIPTKINFFQAIVVSPVKFPYSTPGYIIAIIGVIILGVSFIRRKM